MIKDTRGISMQPDKQHRSVAVIISAVATGGIHYSEVFKQWP